MFYEAEDFFCVVCLEVFYIPGQGGHCDVWGDLYKVDLLGAIKLATLTLVLQFLIKYLLLSFAPIAYLGKI